MLLCLEYWIWYQYCNITSFHFFDDLYEWRGMDKLGHAFAVYSLSTVLYQLGHFRVKKWAAGISLLLVSTIEVWDGLCIEYGASVFDLIANLLGAWLFLATNPQKQGGGGMRYSYFPSVFASFRPQLLGEDVFLQLFKDYNAHTYWIDIPLAGLHNNLKWANVSIGIHSDGMVGGLSNRNILPDHAIDTYLVLSLNVNWTLIFRKIRPLESITSIVSLWKIPFPYIGMSLTRGTPIVGWIYPVGI